MRCFLGLPVPEPLLPLMLGLQEAVPVGRPVPEENLHLTLAFLDDQPAAVLDELHMALDGSPLPGCEMAVAGLTAFGGRRVKLLAAEVARAPGLVALRRAVLKAATAAGIELPRERFRPHVTLVRFGAGLGPADRARFEEAVAHHAGVRSDRAPVEVMRLVGSTLTPAGAVYETLAEYRLDAGSGED